MIFWYHRKNFAPIWNLHFGCLLSNTLVDQRTQHDTANCQHAVLSTPQSLSELCVFHDPICSMYGIFTCIWVNIGANVGKYFIPGTYGDCCLESRVFIHILLPLVRIAVLYTLSICILQGLGRTDMDFLLRNAMERKWRKTTRYLWSCGN